LLFDSGSALQSDLQGLHPPWSETELTTLLRNRDHPASEVYVTGTFDDWAKSVKLVKKGDIFEKLVELPQVEEKIYYKVCTSSFRSFPTTIALPCPLRTPFKSLCHAHTRSFIKN